MLKSVLNACNDNHNLVPRVPLLRGGKKRDPGNEFAKNKILSNQ